MSAATRPGMNPVRRQSGPIDEPAEHVPAFTVGAQQVSVHAKPEQTIVGVASVGGVRRHDRSQYGPRR